MFLIGICKKCGFLVIEYARGGDFFPYQNMCLNQKCEESKWHEYEVNELGVIAPDYYEEVKDINKRIKIDRR